MTSSQKIVLFFLRLLSHMLLSWEIRGRKNVPPNGALIAIVNHAHLLDPILLMLEFPRWINFMAKEELFQSHITGPLVRWAKAFSISRKGTLKDKQEAIRRAQNVLQQEFILGMFPEGKRSANGKLQAAKAGPAAIAAQTGAPLLPVGITGTEKIKGISWLWKRPHIVITIGQPFSLPPGEGKLKRSQLRALTSLMMTRIAALLPPEYRGIYSDCCNDDNN